jgi:hypothetical protein
MKGETCDEVVPVRGASEEGFILRFGSQASTAAESYDCNDRAVCSDSDLESEESCIFPTSIHACRSQMAIATEHLEPKICTDIFKSLTHEQLKDVNSTQQRLDELLEDLDNSLMPANVRDETCCPPPVLMRCTRSSLIFRRRLSVTEGSSSDHLCNEV